MIILCAECALSFYNSGVLIKEKMRFHNDPSPRVTSQRSSFPANDVTQSNYVL